MRCDYFDRTRLRNGVIGFAVIVLLFLLNRVIGLTGAQMGEDANIFGDESDNAELPDNPLEIAVCMVGGARSFNSTWKSIQTNLLEALARPLREESATALVLHRLPRVDLFAEISVADTDYRTQILSILTREFSMHLTGLRMPSWALDVAHLSAQVKEFAEVGKIVKGPLLSALHNYAEYERCFEMIKEQERAKGTRYGWIVRTRPDLEWLGPHPPLALLQSVAERDARKRYNESVGFPPDAFATAFVQDVAHWDGANDRHVVFPRRLASALLGTFTLLKSGIGLSAIRACGRKGTEGVAAALAKYYDFRFLAFPPVSFLRYGGNLDGLGLGWVTVRMSRDHYTVGASGARYEEEHAPAVNGARMLQEAGGWDVLVTRSSKESDGVFRKLAERC